MTYVIVGLGAVGGTMAAQLHRSGRKVVGVARGEHGAVLRRDGLLLRTPAEDHRVELPVVEAAGDVDFHDDDVIVVATKSQDSHVVMAQAAAVAPPGTPVVCAQNGVSNEPEALRWFAQV